MPWAYLSVLGLGAWLGASSLSWMTDDSTDVSQSPYLTIFVMTLTMIGTVVFAIWIRALLFGLAGTGRG